MERFSVVADWRMRIHTIKKKIILLPLIPKPSKCHQLVVDKRERSEKNNKISDPLDVWHSTNRVTGIFRAKTSNKWETTWWASWKTSGVTGQVSFLTGNEYRIGILRSWRGRLRKCFGFETLKTHHLLEPIHVVNQSINSCGCCGACGGRGCVTLKSCYSIIWLN